MVLITKFGNGILALRIITLADFFENPPVTLTLLFHRFLRALLASATLGNVMQIEMILFLSHCQVGQGKRLGQNCSAQVQVFSASKVMLVWGLYCKTLYCHICLHVAISQTVFLLFSYYFQTIHFHPNLILAGKARSQPEWSPL